MNILLFAEWLNTAFYDFDFSILNFYHNLAETTGYHIGWLFRAVTSLAEHGYGMLLLSFLMILIPLVPALRHKYPEKCKAVFMCGVIALFGIAIGSIGTNLTIKEAVARPRPYQASDLFNEWWALAGGNLDPEYSFPSGHTTCTMAVMTAIFLCGNRKKSWVAFLFAIIMGATRNYFMMHYPTDIIGGLVVGGVAATISYIIWKYGVFRYAEKNVFKKLFKQE